MKSFCKFVFLFIICFQTGFSQQRWDDFYLTATEAISESKWEIAIDALNKALEKKSKPDYYASTYTMREENYLPFYWLGVAHYNLGDFEKASLNFSKSLQWTEIKKDNELHSRLISYQKILQQSFSLDDSLANFQTLYQQLEEKNSTELSSKTTIDQKWQEIRKAVAEGSFTLARSQLDDLRRLLPKSSLVDAAENLIQSAAGAQKQIEVLQTSSIVLQQFDEGLTQFLAENYQAAHRTFSEVRQRAPGYRNVGRWLERTEYEIEKTGAVPFPLPSDTVTQIQYRSSPLVVIANLPEAISEDSTVVQITATDDEGVDYVEIKLNGVLYQDSLRNKSGKYFPGSEDRRRFSFEERLPLKFGKNEILATVYDVDRSRKIGLDRVSIRRNIPIYRTLPFWIGVGAIILSIFVALLVRRQMKQRIAFVNKYNPYIAGAPVRNPKMFFGRDNLLRKIINTLHNNSLMIYGPRRIGKTSLLHQLKKRLEKEKDREYFYVPVYIDLQGTPEHKFFSVMMHDIVEGCDTYLPADMSLRIATKHEGYTPRDFSADIKNILNQLKTASKKTLKLVLLIDEVDELNAYTERANQKLRSIFMKTFAENLVAVMSGSYIRKHWESEGSPWYNFFEQIEVGGIHEKEAVLLIREPVKGFYTYDDDAVEKIISYSEWVPYRIQKFCVNIISNVIEERRRHITVADVEKVKEKVLESEEVTL